MVKHVARAACEAQLLLMTVSWASVHHAHCLACPQTSFLFSARPQVPKSFCWSGSPHSSCLMSARVGCRSARTRSTSSWALATAAGLCSFKPGGTH